MTQQIVKTLNPNGSGADNFTTVADAFTYIRGLNPVADDSNVKIVSYIDVTWAAFVNPIAADNTHFVTWTAAAGLGVNDINRSTFNTGAGIAVTLPHSRDGLFVKWGVDFVNINVVLPNDGRTDAIYFTDTCARTDFDNKIRYCRVWDQSLAGAGSVNLGANYHRMEIADSLIVTERATFIFNDSYGYSRIHNCTFAARGAGLGAAGVMSTQYGGPIITDSVFIGFGATILNNAQASNCFSNTTPTGGATSGITVNTAVGALVVNETNDFRPTANGPLIGAAGTDVRTSNDVLGNNRGTAPDIGAWQLNPVMTKPNATITGTQVSGSTVTISGTTTNIPSTATASLTPVVTSYNDGVAQANVIVTLGAGTFTVTFNNVHVGRYNLSLSFTNPGGTSVVTGNTTVDVTGAQGVITSQVLDGQQITISGTTTGTPTSGVCIIPPATVPNGALQQGPTAITLGSGTFTVTMIVPPGDYDKPLVRLTTNGGTSFPITGGNTFSVIGIQGNPEAPPGTPPATPDTTLPVLAGSITATAITTSGFTMSWQAATDNVGISAYEYSTNGGTSYTSLGNVLTVDVAGLAPSTAYALKVRAVDTSGNRSTPITGSVTTSAPPVDSTAPVMVGSLAVSAVAQTSATLTWTAATDNTAVTGYERSLDGGTSYIDVGLVTSINLTGLTAGSTYNARIRAYDAAGNRATPISASFTTTAAADATAPTMGGSLTVANITQTGASLSWIAGTDNNAVTGYEYSVDGGIAYTDVGLVLVKALTGLTPSTTYQVRVRAYDAAGNKSVALSAQLTTLSAADATAPVMTGTVSVGAISQTTLALSWQAATDNVAVTGYEYSLDGGIVYTSVGNSLGVTAVNLTPDVPYNIRVRAFDSAGNRSIPLSVSARTAANASSFTPSVARTVAVQPSAPNFVTGKFWTMVAGAPRGPKDPDSTIDITFDWSAWLADMGGSSIAKVKFTLQGVQDAGSYATGSKTTVFVSGGSVGTAAVSCRITTDSMPARVDERTVYLDLGEQ